MTRRPASLLGLLALLVPLAACGPAEEAVDFEALLPEGAVREITAAYPEFTVSLVGEDAGNVEATFGERALYVTGIEDDATRDRMAAYVVQYLENPNKATEDRAAREAYDALPAAERLEALVERIRERYPDFEYEWTALGEGNVSAEYGDNSLLMTGVDSDGAREEWAHAIIRLQREIDEANPGEGG